MTARNINRVNALMRRMMIEQYSNMMPLVDLCPNLMRFEAFYLGFVCHHAK